ncbi:hypothetical protein HPP92_006710 [Vanilla planifolia]|uniref:Uncharacterized protein n=1 Tax=Vanilla planifolia TaxID=51239 RepID=A0A835V8Y0_VANPL|nr:hypothetical protein HPP92_006710 [Vanilla planifolia]
MQSVLLKQLKKCMNATFLQISPGNCLRDRLPCHKQRYRRMCCCRWQLAILSEILWCGLYSPSQSSLSSRIAVGRCPQDSRIFSRTLKSNADVKGLDDASIFHAVHEPTDLPEKEEPVKKEAFNCGFLLAGDCEDCTEKFPKARFK